MMSIVTIIVLKITCILILVIINFTPDEMFYDFQPKILLTFNPIF